MTKARDNATQGGLVLLSRQSFTEAYSVSFNNVFSSSYKGYRVNFEKIYGDFSDNVYFNFRVGSQDTFNGYDSSILTSNASNTTIESTRVSNGYQAQIIQYVSSSDYPSAGFMDIYGVGSTSQKPNLVGQIWSQDNNYILNNFGASIRNSNIYTGFSISGMQSSLYGTISVYGMK
jgi:hypothetical protein